MEVRCVFSVQFIQFTATFIGRVPIKSILIVTLAFDSAKVPQSAEPTSVQNDITSDSVVEPELVKESEPLPEAGIEELNNNQGNVEIPETEPEVAVEPIAEVEQEPSTENVEPAEITEAVQEETVVAPAEAAPTEKAASEVLDDSSAVLETEQCQISDVTPPEVVPNENTIISAAPFDAPEEKAPVEVTREPSSEVTLQNGPVEDIKGVTGDEVGQHVRRVHVQSP